MKTKYFLLGLILSHIILFSTITQVKADSSYSLGIKKGTEIILEVQIFDEDGLEDVFDEYEDAIPEDADEVGMKYKIIVREVDKDAEIDLGILGDYDAFCIEADIWEWTVEEFDEEPDEEEFEIVWFQDPEDINDAYDIVDGYAYDIIMPFVPISVVKYLDENLDFSRHKMTFIGNSPIKFKNIKYIKPIPSEKLAKTLKQHDIFITASRNDPCSNSLVEALSCGLPTIALNDGGHPELVQRGGELFEDKKTVIKKIEKVAENYQNYQFKIPKFSIKKVVQDYYKFAERIYSDVSKHKYQPKKITFSTKLNFYKMRLMILKWKSLSKLKTKSVLS